MKKIITILLLLVAMTMLIADDFELSGTNDLEFIYKAVDDSLKTYFYNELSLVANYKKLVFGMKFIAEMPRYDNELPLEDLAPRDVEVKWDERYLTYEGDNLLLHAGTTEESIGSGLLFRAYRDDDVDVDTRLDGVLIKAETDYFRAKALYGAKEHDTFDEKYELAYLMDLETSMIPHTTIGATYFENQQLITSSAYNLSQLYGFRLVQEWDFLDFYGEYARNTVVDSKIDGDGYYANLNTYFSDFTVTGVYKNFKDMNYDLNDVPTANYHEETLSDDRASGADEEGFMGEFSWTPEGYHFFASYAEAWDSEKDRKMNDFFGSIGKMFGEMEITAECGYWEKVNDAAVFWNREITPTLIFDIPTETLGFHIKAEYQRIEKEAQGIEKNHWEPLLQADVSYDKHSFSIIAETNVEEIGEIANSRFFINAEFRTNIYENTDVVLFGGSEKGGKVCRNGVCKTVKPFDGIRLELSTRF